MGVLILEADPAGEVKIDEGDYRDAGGARISVSPGSHLVTFKGKNGMTRETRLHVAAGGSVGAKCYFNGVINVVTSQEDGKSMWGSLYVDGARQEQPAPTRLLLPAGRYKIRVTHDGYEAIPREKFVTLEPSFDGPPTVSVAFKFKKQ